MGNRFGFDLPYQQSVPYAVKLMQFLVNDKELVHVTSLSSCSRFGWTQPMLRLDVCWEQHHQIPVTATRTRHDDQEGLKAIMQPLPPPIFCLLQPLSLCADCCAVSSISTNLRKWCRHTFPAGKHGCVNLQKKSFQAGSNRVLKLSWLPMSYRGCLHPDEEEGQALSPSARLQCCS